MRMRILLLLLAFLFWPVSLIISSGSLFPFAHLLVTPKLVLFPFLVSVFTKSPRGILVSSLLLVIFWPAFIGQTIFHPDYERQQAIIRNIHLYPNVLLARAYQNKGYIYLDKWVDNLTRLLDPNNYFFANHPRESRDNPNLPKFPFPTIIFFLIGLFQIVNRKPARPAGGSYFVYLTSTAAIINLSILTVPFGHDFLLWPVIFYFIFQGVKVFQASSFRFKTPVYVIISFLSLFEFMKLISSPLLN